MQERVFFKNPSGEKICGVLSSPFDSLDPAIIDHKVLIISNGFPSTKDSPTYIEVEKVVNKIGVATLRYDYSGSGESEGKMGDFNVLKSVDDLDSAVKFLIKRGFRHIGLYGFSYGGIVSIVLASQNIKIDLLVLKSPVCNYKEERELKNRGDHDKEWKRVGFIIREDRQGNSYRLPYRYYEKLVAIDGRKLASKITIPTLLIHGSADTDIPVIQSEKLAKVMPNVRFEIIKGADHHYSSPEDNKRQLKLTKEFIKQQWL